MMKNTLQFGSFRATTCLEATVFISSSMPLVGNDAQYVAFNCLDLLSKFSSKFIQHTSSP